MHIIAENAYNNITCIRYLLAAGTNIHAKDKLNYTAYDYAKSKDRKDIVVLLNTYYLKMVSSIGGYLSIIPRDIREYIEKFSFFMSRY